MAYHKRPGTAGRIYELWRLWSSQTTKTADARHWRMSVKGVRDAATIPPPRKEKPAAAPVKGVRVRLVPRWKLPLSGAVVASSPSNFAR